MTPTQFKLPVLAEGRPESQPPAIEESAGEALAPAPDEGVYGRSYWRSLEERVNGKAGSPHADGEFAPGAALPPQGFARREFIQLAAASMALAGLDACTEKPVERILPYTKTPDGLAPGIPLHFATATQVNGEATGVVVTSWEGRPVKIEGNPDHPDSHGATGLREQALTLQLYDPQRARLFKYKGSGKAWRALRETIAEVWAPQLQKDGGARLRFLLEPSSSPFEDSLRAQVQKRFPNARFYTAPSIFKDNAYEGARLALGDAYESNVDLEKADVVVSLDADFLESRAGQLGEARAFANRRDPKHPRGLNRLYAVEPTLSITGGMADNRLRLRASNVEELTLGLLGYIAANGPGAAARLPAGATDLGRRVTLTSEQQRFLTAMARDLIAHAGRSVVLVGYRQSPLAHAIGHVINAALGNVGQTLHYSRPAQTSLGGGFGALKALADEMAAGQVETLVITAWNPVYSAPSDVDFEGALKKVSHAVYIGLYEDETSAAAMKAGRPPEGGGWFVPMAHTLESWGDARSRGGTASIVQPLIAPLFNGVTRADLLAAFINAPEARVYDMLRASWARSHPGPDFDSTWETWLSRGLIPDTQATVETPTTNIGAVLQAARASAPASHEGYELNVVHDYKLLDGRFANSSWLQEIADPITKLTWDNAALISPTTAAELGVATGDRVSLALGDASVEAPVFVLPGHADQSVTVALGYGRKGAEEVARGVGFNVNGLRTSKRPWFAQGLKITPLKAAYKLATTQSHWSMEGRRIALMQTAEEFKKAPEAPELRRPEPTIFAPFDYSKEAYRWAMSVDLGRCTGCMACVIACQAENNIPVVGKEQVSRGRAMHWMRVDRYFTGSETAPEMVTQPVMCQQCETAPCEYVCPVEATVHSDEGLNDMVYNRCIGTRYCSNNCPYKVRHFNYLHWNANMDPYQRMAMNPDVTVRDRGVMEKCTYCVQRIERTRIVARIEGRAIRDEEVKTACQQVCPTDAIVFGNLADPSSEVSQRHADPRRYDLLHELNTRPRTAYLTRLKNPNPELA